MSQELWHLEWELLPPLPALRSAHVALRLCSRPLTTCLPRPQFHSHQLFHIFVVAGAFVHFHGVSNLQEFRFMIGGGCTEEDAL